MITQLTLFFATFLSIGLRVAQTRNIVKMDYRSVFLTSVGIDLSMVIGVTGIVTEGWGAFPAIALGGACGSVCFLYFHKRIFG